MCIFQSEQVNKLRFWHNNNLADKNDNLILIHSSLSIQYTPKSTNIL